MQNKSKSTTKCHQFYVHGMHCASCVIWTETELKAQSGVKSVKADLATKTVQIESDFSQETPDQIAQKLNPILAKSGYRLSTKPEKVITNWPDFKLALPIALVIVIGFFLLQKMGVVNLVTINQVNYGTAFILGLVASISTCAAVVGSLVLAVSANYAKVGQSLKPQVLFHFSRLVTFFVLGGVLGWLGAMVSIGTNMTYLLTGLVILVMLILGINLLDILPQAQKWQLTLPAGISQNLLKIKSVNSSLMPLLLGIITFFLPCGFTQSIQLYALTTGSFVTGALIMLFFGLGTLPVLAMLSLGSIKIQDHINSGLFFKVSGLVVIFFALYNLYALLTAVGFISPIL